MSYNIVDPTTGKVMGTFDPTSNSTSEPSSQGRVVSPTVQLRTSEPKVFTVGNAATNSGTGSQGASSGQQATSQGAVSSGGSSGGGGGGSSGTDWVSTIINGVLGIFNANETHTNNAFNQDIATKQQDKANELQTYNERMGVENLNLNREATRLNQANTQEGLLTSGQNRFQSQVAFNQSQQDRRMNQKFMNALSAGMARGLAQRPNPSLLPPVNQPTNSLVNPIPNSSNGVA